MWPQVRRKFNTYNQRKLLDFYCLFILHNVTRCSCIVHTDIDSDVPRGLFFERSRSISDIGSGENIKLCSLPDPLCFTPSFILPSSELSFIWQFENFLRKLKKLHQTRLTLGRWKWIYSWNGSLFPSWMFIIPLYIKSSQDLCANGFSLVVAAFEL